MEKIVVDKERCIGCGLCVSVAPNNFDFDDNGTSNVIDEKVTEEAQEVKEMCPTSAIDIVEDKKEEKE